MAKTGISQIQVTDTFQTWLNRTNQLLTLMSSDVLTASSGAGDTTTGNVKLVGDMSANNFTANVAVDSPLVKTSSISQRTGNTDPLLVLAVTKLTAANNNPLVMENILGPKIKYATANAWWEAGAANNSIDSPFVINQSASPLTPRLSLTPAGDLMVAGTFVPLGGMLAANGSATNPSITFSSDLDTGIYRISADKIGVATGGAQRLFANNTHLVANVVVGIANGAVSSPALIFSSDLLTGIYRDGVGAIALSSSGQRAVSFRVSSTSSYFNFGDANTVVSNMTTAGLMDINAETGVRIGRSISTDSVSKLSIMQAGSANTVILLNGDGRAQFGFGSEASPALSFVGDTDTGIWRVGSNIIGISTGGSQRLQVTTNSIDSSVGLKFGNVVGGALDDVTKHIALFSDTYGLGVTSSSLNAVLPETAVFRVLDRATGQIRLQINPALGGSATVQGSIYGGIFTSQYEGGGSFRASLTSPASVPSYTWTGDTDTGMFHNSTGVIGFSSGGARKAFLSASRFHLDTGVVFDGDGSQLTNMDAGALASGTTPIGRYGTDTTFRDWVLARYAAQSGSVVGTLAFLSFEGGTGIIYGTNYAGGTLRPAGMVGSGDAQIITRPGAFLTGTWKALGYLSSVALGATLFLKVAS